MHSGAGDQGSKHCVFKRTSERFWKPPVCFHVERLPPLPMGPTVMSAHCAQSQAFPLPKERRPCSSPVMDSYLVLLGDCEDQTPGLTLLGQSPP